MTPNGNEEDIKRTLCDNCPDIQRLRNRLANVNVGEATEDNSRTDRPKGATSGNQVNKVME